MRESVVSQSTTISTVKQWWSFFFRFIFSRIS